MSAASKEKFATALKNKISHEDDKAAGYSLIHIVKEQESFIKAVDDYAETASIVELLKVYRIISNEICSRAEFGEFYKDINSGETHIEPLISSTPKEASASK